MGRDPAHLEYCHCQSRQNTHLHCHHLQERGIRWFHFCQDGGKNQRSDNVQMWRKKKSCIMVDRFNSVHIWLITLQRAVKLLISNINMTWITGDIVTRFYYMTAKYIYHKCYELSSPSDSKLISILVSWYSQLCWLIFSGMIEYTFFFLYIIIIRNVICWHPKAPKDTLRYTNIIIKS